MLTKVGIGWHSSGSRWMPETSRENKFSRPAGHPCCLQEPSVGNSQRPQPCPHPARLPSRCGKWERLCAEPPRGSGNPALGLENVSAAVKRLPTASSLPTPPRAGAREVTEGQHQSSSQLTVHPLQRAWSCGQHRCWGLLGLLPPLPHPQTWYMPFGME